MSPAIRVIQTHDGSGQPAAAESVIAIEPRAGEALSATIRDALRPWTPSTTADPGVYTYAFEQGSGWLRLEGVALIDTNRVDDLVRLLETERVVGTDPMPGTELGALSPLVIHQRNPVTQIVFGAVGVTVGIVAAVQPLFLAADGTVAIVLVLMGAILAALGTAVIIVGSRRLRWWRNARAEALTSGKPLPDDLKLLG